MSRISQDQSERVIEALHIACQLVKQIFLYTNCGSTCVAAVLWGGVGRPSRVSLCRQALFLRNGAGVAEIWVPKFLGFGTFVSVW
jgi:hypothetical protein